MILDVGGNEFDFKVYNTGAALGELDGVPAYVLAVEAFFPPNSSLAVSATTLFATCTRCADGRPINRLEAAQPAQVPLHTHAVQCVPDP